MSMSHRASSDAMFLLPLRVSSRLLPSATGPLHVMLLLSRILPRVSSPSLHYQSFGFLCENHLLNNVFSGPLT